MLRESYHVIATAIREERAITPAAEWLVDNFHVVDEQLREIRDDLPPGFYRELPKLTEGPLVGYPRVYGLAWAFVAHTDSRFDPEMLRRFVRAYQRVQPLTIGELWAVAITLRVVLVENLRRLAESIVRGRAARQEADALADELLGVGDDGTALRTARGLARFESDPLVTAFAVQLVQRLREQDRAVTPALLWLDQRLEAQGTTSDDIVRVEHQRQAAMNVTVRNVILSMSLMSALDWTEFFETRQPRGRGAAGRPESRRHGLRHSRRLPACDRGPRAGLGPVRAGRGARGDGPCAASRTTPETSGGPILATISSATGASSSRRRSVTGRRRCDWLLRVYVGLATPGYLGTIAVFSGAVLALPLLAGGTAGVGSMGLLILALLAIVPASDLAIALLNRIVAALVTPAVLPRLELLEGVPAELRTLVAVPMLLTDVAEIDEQIERLEVHYLANPDGDVRFALLSDWTDATAASAPGDDGTLAAAREGIARLNAPSRRRSRWRYALPALPSPPALERERAHVDGMGAQAGQAARAEPAPARRHRHQLPAHGHRGTRRCPLRDHPGRRHAAAARGGRAPGRHHGASAQPAADRPRPRGAWSRATRCSSRG